MRLFVFVNLIFSSFYCDLMYHLFIYLFIYLFITMPTLIGVRYIWVMYIVFCKV